MAHDKDKKNLPVPVGGESPQEYVHVIQTDNTVYGDQAGGNISKIVYEAKPTTRMSTLISQFKAEIAQNQAIGKTIEELEHFTKVVESPVIGLDQKLIDGQRQDEINKARERKELFSKKLLRFEHSEAAQKILAFTLADMQVRFERLVYPLLNSQATRVDIDKVLVHEVTGPVLGTLEENVLEISHLEIDGMVYFLTGNCHIRWKP